MAKQPDPWPRLSTRLQALERALGELSRRSPYTGSGMHPNGENGVQVDGDLIIDGNLDLNGSGNVSGTWQSADFDGDLGAGNAGTKGWAFNSLRAAIGELFLRPGSVTNDALASPVVPNVARGSANNFALPTPGTLVEVAGYTITVPAGCTQLLATVSGSVFAYNPNTTGGSNGAGGDAIYCALRLGTQSSQTTVVGVSGFAGYATAFGDESFVFSGLTGGQTLRLSVYGASAYQAIAANPGNRAAVSATLVFLR